MNLSETTVLISDPDPLTLSSLARHGRSLGLSVVTDICCDVLALAERYRPDTVVLEIRQKVDGRDLLSALRKNPATRNTKVIVFSSVVDPFMEATCLELGASAYILKPERSQSVMTRAAQLAGFLPEGPVAVA